MVVRLPTSSRSTYFNKRTVVDGIKFDSQLESQYYLLVLKNALHLGLIHDLTFHPCYPISINGHSVFKVLMDFGYSDAKTGEPFSIDVKGKDNPLSRLKRKCVIAAYPTVNFHVMPKPFWLPLSDNKSSGIVKQKKIKKV